ncbi:hypothetical protein H4J38_04335 [Colwellia sp. BRX10-3]|uniref:hypothetical protein n=1 Tax=Colwellia sp. BRX10-3 TaxID=2759844 RepID=UPI0015F6EB60|nr:hypothetical protein [Colwellia sp. BRX10-3]MBA6390007.1 hypothetical protein [Colwellia sp. BRX10-3]
MPLNTFKTIDNYGAMLNKLASINFIVLLILLHFISTQSEVVQKFLDGYSWEVTVVSLKIPIGYFLPCFVAALFGRIIKLHDRISDLFRIRPWYDWIYILEPMLKEVGSKQSKKVILNNRGSIMLKVFYKYASSKDPNSVVDKHLIELVMDQLSWYWIVLESSLSIFIATIILLYLKCFDHVHVVFYIGLGLIVFAKTIQNGCSKYTKREVSKILEYPPRRKEIKDEFDAISSQ